MLDEAEEWLKENPYYVALGLMILSITIRALYLPNSEMHPDGYKWLKRSVKVLANYSYGGKLLQPGVFPALILGSFIKLLGMNVSSFSLEIFQPLMAGRVVNLLVGSLIPSVVFLSNNRFRNFSSSAISSIILVFSPIMITTNTILHIDTILSFTFLVAAISIFIWSKTKSKKYLVISGILTGITVASKLPGLALITFPIFGFILLEYKDYRLLDLRPIDIDKILENFKEYLVSYLNFFLVFLLTLTLLYPRFWNGPIQSFASLFGKTSRLTSGSVVHAPGNYWMGDPVASTPIYFYLLLLLISLNPITIFGNIASFGYTIKESLYEKIRVYELYHMLWILAFLIPLSISNKKLGWRYITPIMAPIAILAGIGIDKILNCELISRKFGKIKYIPIILIVLLPSILTLGSLAQYNNAVGDSLNRSHIWMLNPHSPGYDEGFEYIKENYEIDTKILVLGNTKVARYHDTGEISQNGEIVQRKKRIFDAEFQWQSGSPPPNYDLLIVPRFRLQINKNTHWENWTSTHEEVFKVKKHGLETLYIYNLTQ